MISKRINFLSIAFWISIQILILNNIFLADIATPYLYIITIILSPLTINRQLFMVIAFLIGLVIDIFEATGGVFAASTLLIAYLRPVFLNICFGLAYEQMTIKFQKESFFQKLSYVSLMTITHHLALFSLEAFSLNNVLMIIEKTLFSSILGIFIMIIVIKLIEKK